MHRFPITSAVLLLMMSTCTHGQEIEVCRVTAGASLPSLAHSLGRLPDLDGDGYDELIVGNPWVRSTVYPYSIIRGEVCILSGANWSALHVFRRNQFLNGGRFGWAVAGTEDVTGDGMPDVLVGAPHDTLTGAGVRPGTLWVLSGSQILANVGGTTVVTSNPMNPTMPNPAQGVAAVYQGVEPDELGYSVSAAGDFNNDGFRDIVAGSRRATNQASSFINEGKVTVFSGRWIQTGMLPMELQTYWGERTEEEFGFSVSGNWDVDNNGLPDVIIGSISSRNPAAPGLQFNHGRVTVYSGNIELWRTYGDFDNDELGWSVSGFPDITGDNRAEVIAGAPKVDGMTVNEGEVKLLSGLNGSQLLSVPGREASSFFGYSVAWAGDVDDDGNPDIIAGGPGGNIGNREGYAQVFNPDVTGPMPTVTTIFVVDGDPNPQGELPFPTVNWLDRLGHAVIGMGDLNGNGDEVAIGAPFTLFDFNIPRLESPPALNPVWPQPPPRSYVTVVGLPIGGPANTTILKGIDLLATDGNAVAIVSAMQNFFNPGSDPLTDVAVNVKGQQLTTNPDLTNQSMFVIDTVIERLQDVDLPEIGSSGMTPIEFKALHLGEGQVTVTYNNGQNPEIWDLTVYVASGGMQGTTMMTISRDCLWGGSFVTQLSLVPRLVFTRMGMTRVMDPGPSIMLGTLNGAWCYEVDPGSVYFPVAFAPPGVEIDGDGDGVLEFMSMEGTTNFFPGVQPAGCGDPYVPGGFPLASCTLVPPGPDHRGDERIPTVHTAPTGHYHSTATPSAECHLMMGFSQVSLGAGGDTLLVAPIAWWPVTTSQVPVFQIPDAPVLNGIHIYMQVLLVNPTIFPDDPVKLSNGLDIEIGGPVTSYGTSSGLTLTAPAPATINAPFTVTFF